MPLQVQIDPGTTLMIGKAAANNHGAGMAGMTVTADFGVTTDTATWISAGPQAGRTGPSNVKGWSLEQDGDTSAQHWTLINDTGKNLRSVTIDGMPGATIFDMTNPNPGTTGSANGRTFTPAAGGALRLDMIVTYRDRVRLLTASSAVGDLYRKLEIAFTKKGPFKSGGRLKFFADTDRIEIGHIPSQS